MSRPDWERAIKIPLGHIPAGSANGMASSVAFSNDELFQNISLEYFSSTMAFNLNKYLPKPLDLVAIQLENGTFLHSFLNVEWAIVADVDLESERYRYLGGLRFLVGALIRILSKSSF
jgi:sphingosine kinase